MLLAHGAVKFDNVLRQLILSEKRREAILLERITFGMNTGLLGKDAVGE
jgi:hypothetical protein